MDPKTIEISLTARNNKLEFKSGQFIFISFLQTGISKEEHPFSILSSPNEDLLKITVKTAGDYTQQLYNNLQAGAVAMIEGPFGSFSYTNTNNRNQIWIAGGVGVTPFVSFVKSINAELEYNITLFYCVRKEAEALYLALLTQYAQIFNHSLQVIPFYSQEKGHLTLAHITEQVPAYQEYDYYFCAPPTMIEQLRRELMSAGIASECIHSEEFNF